MVPSGSFTTTIKPVQGFLFGLFVHSTRVNRISRGSSSAPYSISRATRNRFLRRVGLSSGNHSSSLIQCQGSTKSIALTSEPLFTSLGGAPLVHLRRAIFCTEVETSEKRRPISPGYPSLSYVSPSDIWCTGGAPVTHLLSKAKINKLVTTNRPDSSLSAPWPSIFHISAAAFKWSAN